MNSKCNQKLINLSEDITRESNKHMLEKMYQFVAKITSIVDNK